MDEHAELKDAYQGLEARADDIVRHPAVKEVLGILSK